jgi:hypothetical protein
MSEPTESIPIEPAATMPPPQAPPTTSADVAPVDEAPADDGTEFFDQLESLLDKLVPADSVTVTTATQGEITLPGSIPARLQVRVFRHMRDLLEMDEINSTIASFSGGPGGQNMADAIVSLATNEAVAEKLGDIFTAAYPNSLDGNDPLDELPLEDLVAALSPFSQRFLKKLGTGFTRMAKGATNLQ